MIGSPDVVAFIREDEYGETNPNPSALPAEFSVPLHPLAGFNPWAKTSFAKFARDFILISEFSEQVGPQPLLTVPDDPNVCGTFDLNYFSLRIMSVDYQASFVGHPPGTGYPRLSFVEDSRVVLGDSKEGAFAYVHHLTLYDLEARGFVRPFCMAYVSADERKIMLQFQELSLRFSQASECLKAGNRRAFAKELQRKLQDLEYTHSVLQREEGLQREAGPQRMYSPHAVEKANELANVEKSIYEHRDLLRQISSYHQRPRRDPHAAAAAAACQRCVADCLGECEELLEKHGQLAKPFSCGDEGRGRVDDERGFGDEREAAVKHGPSYTPRLIKAKSAKCFDKRLKTLRELCDDTFYASTVELLKATEKSFRGDLSYLHTRRLDGALRRKQRVTNFLFEEGLGDDEDEGRALRPFCAVNHALDNYTLLNPPPIVLGPEPLELDGLAFPDPQHPAPEARNSQRMRELGLVEARLESAPLEGEESSEEAKGSFSSGDSGTSRAGRRQDPASMMLDAPDPDPDPDSDLTPDADHNADLERESSSEDIETTAGEDEGDQTPVSLLDVMSEPDASRDDASEGVANGTCEIESDLLIPADAACCMAQDGLLYEASGPESVPRRDQISRSPPCPNPVVNQEPHALLPLQEDYAVGSPSSERPAAGLLADGVSGTSADDGSDYTMSASAGSDRAASPLGYGAAVTPRQKKKAAQGALRFVRQYPFATQALWCLLSGRTLVVLGADEGRVRRLVGALALFVPAPGRCGERVQAWLSCPFTLNDLQRWKLIGLQRVASPVGSSMFYSLSRYSRYVSVLDADQKTLRCPPYQGRLLANVSDRRTSIRRGSTYFLHLQSALCRLAAKAFLLTFTHHLHLPVSFTEGPEAAEGRRRCFLREQLGLGEEDGRVLLYLSRRIAQRYLSPAKADMVTPACFSFNYTTSVLYKI
ncbi:guanine nucleotide exchange protein smcr8a [Brachionichthys hirsutus]|uniref:guanine nucleotide exchange protein smcr8a n=1 Tax=Brachionichthys hirsutus TaxID=412623 RepID=UPI003604860D